MGQMVEAHVREALALSGQHAEIEAMWAGVAAVREGCADQPNPFAEEALARRYEFGLDCARAPQRMRTPSPVAVPRAGVTGCARAAEALEQGSFEL